MKTIIKILILAALVLFTQVHLSEQLQCRGRQLAMLQNLPHRYLGLLYWSWMLQPHRTEYLIEYAVEWNVAIRDRMNIVEGTTKPTVPLLVASEYANHPESDSLRRLSKLLLQEELRDRNRQ